jgi:NitT/TauT family transport system substrate-binding protein
MIEAGLRRRPGEHASMTKARWLFSVLMCLTTLATPVAGRAETVRIARQFGISYLPLILMQDAGLLEREGRARGLDLSVEWITFTGGPPINDALISGSVDLAAGGVGPMLTLWGRTRGNLRVKGVAALGSMPIWLNTSNPAVRSIADFTERDRIALPGVKVSIQAVVLQMAALQAFGPGQQNRLDPLTVSMGHPDGQAALLGGGTEITAHFTAAPYMYAEASAPQVHRVLNSYDVLGGPHTFNLVWATTRYHDRHPEVIAAFTAALDRAMASIRDDPGEAAAVWVRSERARLSPAEAADMIRRPENEWTTTPRRMMEFARFMHATGGLVQAPEGWRDLFFPAVHALDGS